MTSGGNWSVLQLTGDPVPADPVTVQALATFHQREVPPWEEHAQALNETANYGRSMPMTGDFVQPYRTRLDEHPPAATAVLNGYREAGTALSRYSQVLDEAKQQAQIALTRGTQAKANYDQAMATYNQAVAEMNAIPKVVPPEQLQAAIQQYNYWRNIAVNAERYAQEMQRELQAAQQQALQAGQEARQAESAAAQQIQAATPTSGRSGGGSNSAASGSGAPVTATGGFLDQQKTQGPRGWQPGDPIPEPLTGERLPEGGRLDNDFRGENDPNNPKRFFAPDTVKYFNDAEREAHRVFVDGAGSLRWARDGSVLDTSTAKTFWSPNDPKAIFVVDRSGNLYASLTQERGYLHHSSFLAGKSVAGAGEIAVENGRLFQMTNQSGHYRPPPEAIDRVIESLRERGVIFDPTFRFQAVR